MHEALLHLMFFRNLYFPCLMSDLAIRLTHWLNNRCMQITFRAYPIKPESHLLYLIQTHTGRIRTKKEVSVTFGCSLNLHFFTEKEL